MAGPAPGPALAIPPWLNVLVKEQLHQAVVLIVNELRPVLLAEFIEIGKAMSPGCPGDPFGSLVRHDQNVLMRIMERLTKTLHTKMAKAGLALRSTRTAALNPMAKIVTRKSSPSLTAGEVSLARISMAAIPPKQLCAKSAKVSYPHFRRPNSFCQLSYSWCKLLKGPCNIIE